MYKMYISCSIHGSVLHVIFPPSRGTNWSKRRNQFLMDQTNPEQVYSNPQRCVDVLRASARYEGENKFIGFNFPSSFITQEDITLYPYKNIVKYVIAYMDGDKYTIDHEKRHAKYHVNTYYRNSVRRSWNKLKRSNPKRYQNIVKDLSEKGYQEKVFVDEFQAYHPELI